MNSSPRRTVRLFLRLLVADDDPLLAFVRQARETTPTAPGAGGPAAWDDDARDVMAYLRTLQSDEAMAASTN